MASRYWVGGTATWDATAGSKWATTSGGAGGASTPTTQDDVFLDVASGTVTITGASGGFVQCRSLDCTGFTGTLSLANHAAAVQLGSGSTGGGGLTFSSSMTLTLGGSTCTIAINGNDDNGGAGYPITTGGKTMPNIIFGGLSGSVSSKWVLQDSLTTTNAITLTYGHLDTNSQTILCSNFASNNSNTRTLTLGSSTITCSSTGTPWNTSISLVLNAGTSTLIFTAAGTLALNLNGTNPYYNVTRTGTAAKTDTLTVNGNWTINGTFTVNGNSSINRVLIQSSTSIPGTTRTITAASVSFSNVDFMDINGAGAADWNLAGITGGSGDCQGNSGITFTTANTRYAVAAGNWSSTSMWSATSGGSAGASVPLPQDDVFLDANSAAGTYSADMPTVGKNVDCTGFTRTLSMNGTGTTPGNCIYGSLTLSSGMTFVTNAASTNTRFLGRGNHTITSAGKIFAYSSNRGIVITAPGGTYTLADALTVTGTTNNFAVQTGTFNTNNQAITTANASVGTGSLSATVNLGTSTWTIDTNVAGNNWDFTAGTFNGPSSTIVIGSPMTTTFTFVGGGQTYGTLAYTVANSPGTLLIRSNNTFSTLNVGPGRNLQLLNGNTQTITNWNVSGQNNGYQYLPGVSGNYVSTPDSTPLSVTGDIDVRVRVALDTLAASQMLLAKWGSSGAREWRFYTAGSSTLTLDLTADGTNTTAQSSTAGHSIAAGTIGWFRFTWRASDGRIQFFTASGAIANPTAGDFTQLGTDRTRNVGAIFDSATAVTVGSESTGTASLATGKFYRAQIRDGIDGTLVYDADFTAKAVGANSFTESSASTGTVTLNGSLAQAGDGRIAITSSTPGTAATVSSSGSQTSDYLTIQDSTAQGANWYAGTHSLDNGNNHGWIFNTTTPPSTNGNFRLFDN